MKAENHIRKHAELVRKLMREEGMDNDRASKVAQQLLIARARRNIDRRIKNRT